MFNKQRLLEQAIAVAFFGIACLAFDKTAPAAILTSIAIVFFGLYNSIKKTEFNFTSREIFDDNYDLNIVKEKIRSDPEFSNAVQYLYNLPPNDFLKFGRLLTEMRDEANQKWLGDIAKQFRKEKK